VKAPLLLLSLILQVKTNAYIILELIASQPAWFSLFLKKKKRRRIRIVLRVSDPALSKGSSRLQDWNRLPKRERVSSRTYLAILAFGSISYEEAANIEAQK
jgi:hypothetical protein